MMSFILLGLGNRIEQDLSYITNLIYFYNRVILQYPHSFCRYNIHSIGIIKCDISIIICDVGTIQCDIDTI